MNRTRLHVVPALRRLVPALLLLAAATWGLSDAAQADLPGDSPYFGEPILSADGPRQAGGSMPMSGGAPTLRVGGVGGPGNSADLDPYFEVPGGGVGIEARAGHIAGKTVGREESLTHVDLQPYMFIEENMLFSDLRLYRLNQGGLGGNMGAGWRRYFADHDTILGVIGYLDVDDTRSARFQQTGLSLEMLSRWLDVRANWYAPFGDTEQITGTGFVAGSQHFQGNFLLVDATTDFSSAADGVDVTATVPVPWEFLAPYNVEASGGFYHYQVPGSGLPRVWGYRLRADASFFDRMLHTYVELTNDRQFDTRVVFGASLDYYGGFQTKSRLTDRQYYRMSEFVRRNYNVVTIDSTVVTPDVPVLDPADNQPYFFIHIDNFDGPNPGGDGTFENPYDTINTAFADSMVSPEIEDVFLVHGGSTFTGTEASVVVPENTIFLGENVPGRPQTLPGVGLGLVELPVANPGAGPVTLANAAGSAIDATDAKLVGAFTITDPDENGLLVMGPSALSTPQIFRDITILGADGDGILFNNAAGNYTLNRVTVAAADGIDGAQGIAFHVAGGNAVITAIDSPNDAATDPTFENSGGNGHEIILIENITGGTVDLTETSANDHGGVIGLGGGGIRLLNNAGNVAIGTAIIDNTIVVPATGTTPAGVGAGVEIFGGTGNTSFFGDVTVTNASGVGFLVDSLMPNGLVNVAAGSTITVNSRNTVGAEFRNIMGAVQFSPTLTNGSVPGGRLTIGALNSTTATLDPAIRFRSSTGSVSLNNVSIANSNGDGILIGGPLMADQNIVTVNADGSLTRPRFVATGTTNINSTGSLANLGTAAIRIEGAPFDSITNPYGEGSTVEFRSLNNINTRVDRGIQIVNTSGRIQFSGNTIVNNDAPVQSTRAGLFINNSVSAISFGDFTTNDPIAGEPAVEIHNMPRPGSVGFTNLVINNALGDGMDVPGGDGDLTQGLPTDITGLLVTDVNIFTVTDGTIDVRDGIAVDIQRVFPQTAAGLEVVRDNQNRPVVLDPTTRLPIAVLDADGNPIVDANGNNVIPNVFTLAAFPGYQVALTSVNAIATTVATSQQYGIYLMNNTGTFEITGVPGILGSGGEISGSTIAGLFADDADQVTIRNQDYVGNNRGLQFQNMNETSQQGFFLDAIRVQDSTQEAVFASDVRNITIQDSLFQNNGFIDLDPDPVGFLFADTVRILVNERPDDPFDSTDQDNPLLFPYTYVIDSNTFVDQNPTFGSDGVSIQTAAGFARGSLLTLFFRSNSFLAFDRSTFINDAPRLLNVGWNGTIDAQVSGNAATIVAGNDRTRGFEIRQSSPDDNGSQVVVTNNVINFNNTTGAIGTFFDFVGTARIDATFNNYAMGNGGSTGLQFRLLSDANDVEIASNQLDFGAITNIFGNLIGTGVGVDVVQVVGGAFPSSFLINNNNIGTTGNNGTSAADIAFRFQTTIGQINIAGPQQNTVFANTFFTPLNNPFIVGQININGGFFP